MLGKVYIKNIREWEQSHQRNVLSLFDSIAIKNIIDLFNCFYHWDEKKSCEYIDNYLENKGIYDLISELRDVLLGYKDIDNKSSQKADEIDTENEGEYEDLTKYTFLTDYYMYLCMQLMSLGISYSEFWNLSTDEMYSVYASIQQKAVLDINKAMEIAYVQAGLIGGAVWGKLPKEVPKVQLEQKDEDDVLINTKHGEMSLSVYKSMKALEKL